MRPRRESTLGTGKGKTGGTSVQRLLKSYFFAFMMFGNHFYFGFEDFSDTY